MKKSTEEAVQPLAVALFASATESLSLADAIGVYLQLADVSESTHKNYKQSLGVLLAYIDAEMGVDYPLASISHVLLLGWKQWLMGERELYADHPNRPNEITQYSNDTVRKHMGHVATFFNWCVNHPLEHVDNGQLVETYLLDRNPMRRVKRPPKQKRPPKALEVVSFFKMLDAVEKTTRASCKRSELPRFIARNRAILMYLGSSAGRSEGLRTATIGDLVWSPDGTQVKIWVLEKGKFGRKKGRYVYLYEAAAIALLMWLDVHPNPKPTAPLFCNLKTGHIGTPIKERSLYGILETIAANAGVGSNHGAHAFRHMAIMQMLRKLKDLSKVSQLAGHADVKVTEGNYAQWVDDELQSSHANSAWF